MEQLSVAQFIERWSRSGGSERANSQRFLVEFISFLGASEMPTEQEATPAYCFERAVPYVDETGATHDLRIDLYKRGCFVLESKQGIETRELTPLEKIVASPARGAKKRGTTAWDKLMIRAFNQAQDYVRRLPSSEGRPPFIIVADAGFCFDLYAEFSRTGGYYTPFPSPGANRFHLADFGREEVRDLFRAIWEAPLTLDPSSRSAKVTCEIAEYLAVLARSLESGGHAAETVSAFLMRCLFTMFAEDVGLLPNRSFSDLLQKSLAEPEGFRPTAEELWKVMNIGGWSVALNRKLLRFNGGLFAEWNALPLDKTQIGVLLKAAEADWREVEPAIFGTLLERALDPRERHKLGAHFTPRAYVERLVIPTVITPLREEWASVQAAAAMAAEKGDLERARKILAGFYNELCRIQILDPACGTGNFLYVTFEHLKRLEGEILEEEARYGETQTRLQMQLSHIDPHQFLGLEVNPRAANIAELVLWIGYLQWHYRTHGDTPPTEPVIKKFKNIECRDAVLAWSDWRFRSDASGKTVSRWDGHSTKVDPITGREVPDPDKKVPDVVYHKPREAAWPKADYVVGNPPFLGGKDKRGVLGQGYFEALAGVYSDLPEACDFVMYWWHKAAALVRNKKIKRFGFITTNSLSQVFNRRILTRHMEGRPPMSLVFAVPDHPWVDSATGAAVRIAMTVGRRGRNLGELSEVVQERKTGELELEVKTAETVGVINPDLTIGADVSAARALKANGEISCPGVKLHGAGFIVTKEQAQGLGLGRIQGLEAHIRPYRNGRDLTGKCREVMVIDLFGLDEEEVFQKYPEVYQWVAGRVKPEREAKASRTKDTAEYADKWLIFGKPRDLLRRSLSGLSRFIGTVETAKHRVFVFLDKAILPDNMLVNIASDDAYHLGVLSSRIHVAWALAAGGTLEDRPRYNKTRCFETFPFPPANAKQQERIRSLAEALDVFRKRQLSLHPGLTLTGMYNALESLRSGKTLTASEQKLHAQALGTVLKKHHDDLDEAVFEAYGWPPTLTDAEILDRLVKLNGERAAEEAKGQVRWLRPDYQLSMPGNGRVKKAEAKAVPLPEAPAEEELAWSRDEVGKVASIMKALKGLGRVSTALEVAQAIKGAHRKQVERILEELAEQGLIRKNGRGFFG
jgi:hypothetical protein